MKGISASRKSKQYSISTTYCTKCGKRGMDIPRAAGRYREAGHLKKLFCWNCNSEQNHVECREIGSYTYFDFKEEFELGRFVDGERIPVKDLKGCNQKDCHYNKHGRCWNSNNSYQCDKRRNKK